MTKTSPFKNEALKLIGTLLSPEEKTNLFRHMLKISDAFAKESNYSQSHRQFCSSIYSYKTSVQSPRGVSLHIRPIWESCTEICQRTCFTLLYITVITSCGVKSPKPYRWGKCFAHTLYAKIIYI